MKIPIRFYYDLGASSTLLLRSWRFYYDLCRFDQNFEAERNRYLPVEWGGGGVLEKILDRHERSGIAVQWKGGGLRNEVDLLPLACEDEK